MLFTLLFAGAVLPLVFGYDAANSKPAAEEGDDSREGQIWAVLVAGSYQYLNYRHQSDICHAYQILRRHGIREKNIIVMMYDDIASDPDNPTKGVIINQPNGTNVYKNVHKDYTASDVSPQNFLNVITGNASALEGIGSGKVLNSGPNDYVFINMVSRGSLGSWSFPNDHLHVADLNDALKTMHKKRMYKHLLIYLESSHSGSMFENVLPKNLNILAVTASRSDEDSYATYWDSYRKIFLGNFFGIAWMEDIDYRDLFTNLTMETIQDQYRAVVERVNVSHPSMYGDSRLTKQHVTKFFGQTRKFDRFASGKPVYMDSLDVPRDAVPSRDVLPITLRKRRDLAESAEDKEKFQSQLNTLLKGRADIEKLLDRILSRLPNEHHAAVLGSYPVLTLAMMPCYRTLVDTFSNECVDINKNTYALNHMHKFANLCNIGSLSTHDILEAFKAECGGPLQYSQGIH